MAETIVTHRARGGLPYSKGLMTQALSATGLTPARAWALARLVEQRLEANGVDVIESSGVLHHLHDPQRGWRVLVSLLRPDGVMHIGLYSAAARSDIWVMEDFISPKTWLDRLVPWR